MTSRQLTADQAFTLLKRRSQNTNVTLRAVAQTVIQTGDLPRQVRPDALHQNDQLTTGISPESVAAVVR